MIHLTNKAKQYGLIALKVLILTATFTFIYHKLNDSSSIFPELFSEVHSRQLWLIPFFLLMVIANWSLEILKWKSLVISLSPITFGQAARQCLMSLSASLVTPNRIGEYGAKALYFKAKYRKKVMVLNLFSNLSQLFTTLLFGIPGLLIFIRNHNIMIVGWKLTALLATLCILVVAAYYFRKTELLIKGLSFEKLYSFMRTLSFYLKLKVLVISGLRYIIFSCLFYLILDFFGAEIHFLEAMSLITSMYLLASIVPAFFIFDMAIKGGVALWLFSYTEVGEIPILCTVLVMWILNFGLPALIGSYFVTRFKPVVS